MTRPGRPRIPIPEEAVRRLLDEGHGVKRIARALGVSTGTAHAWVQKLKLNPESRRPGNGRRPAVVVERP